MKHHVEYTGEGPDGHLIHGDFDQDDNDFKAAEKRAQLEVGPNVHLASVRMWRKDMPAEYALPRPPMVEEPPKAKTEPEPRHLSLVESVTEEPEESEPIPVSAE